jgi:hypothetical protein
MHPRPSRLKYELVLQLRDSRSSLLLLLIPKACGTAICCIHSLWREEMCTKSKGLVRCADRFHHLGVLWTCTSNNDLLARDGYLAVGLLVHLFNLPVPICNQKSSSISSDSRTWRARLQTVLPCSWLAAHVEGIAVEQYLVGIRFESALAVCPETLFGCFILVTNWNQNMHHANRCLIAWPYCHSIRVYVIACMGPVCMVSHIHKHTSGRGRCSHLHRHTHTRDDKQIK